MIVHQILNGPFNFYAKALRRVKRVEGDGFADKCSKFDGKTTENWSYRKPRFFVELFHECGTDEDGAECFPDVLRKDRNDWDLSFDCYPGKSEPEENITRVIPLGAKQVGR